MKNFYITTAIDYANGSPHLGHAYEKVLADVVARTQRLQGQQVHFLTGLDEHGQKVQQSARKEGVEPQALCDSIADEFTGMCRDLDISNDDYVRTTEPRHKLIVQKILQDSTTEDKFTRLSTKVTTAFVRSSLFRKRTKRTANGLNFWRSSKSQRKTTSSNSVIIKTGSSTGSSLTRRLFSSLSDKASPRVSKIH